MYSNAQRYVKLGDVYFNKYNIETFTKIDDQDNNKYELHIHTVYGKNYDFILTSHKELINKIQTITGQRIESLEEKGPDLDPMPF
jgi:hypothetical protein|tara:strand:+ start:542 stop:796 length:255 start_codon:yes stop_codon:yes gene_type:complete